MTERERSAWFWGALTRYAPAGFAYDSLSDISRDSHLIVRGRVTDVQAGVIQPFESNALPGGMPVIFGVVTVDEVLKGTPQSRTPGTILVARLAFEGVTGADLPEGEVVLFLKNYADMRIEEGVGPSSDPDDGYYYSRPNGYQAVLQNQNGLVRFVDGPRGWQEAFGSFPSQLDGRSFDEVVDRIRVLVDGT